MSGIFDAGDKERLERDLTLDEQIPRQPLENDRAPTEILDVKTKDNPDIDMMLSGLLVALHERLQGE